MKKSILILFILTSLNIFAQNKGEKLEIKNVVINSYVNGAFNKLDTVQMRKGFHHSFEIYSAEGDEISRYSIDEWIATIEKRKSDPNFDPAKYQYDFEFLNIETIGNIANVNIQFSKDHRIIYTDYLLLLKFNQGWKIVSKVYH